MKTGTIKDFMNRVTRIMKMYERSAEKCRFYGKKLNNDRLSAEFRQKYQAKYTKYYKIRERLKSYYADTFTEMTQMVIQGRNNVIGITPPMSLSTTTAYIQEIRGRLEVSFNNDFILYKPSI